MVSGLITDIKFNCDISDAQYWGYYSVCGLLMRYRDLFRSEKGMKPWTEIKREEIGAWIEQKEKQWPDLELRPFRDLAVNGRTYDPFDVSGINKALAEEKLVYGAGYGMYLKPSFFLAELKSMREIAGLTIYTSGKELVRDLFTSPGMLQERTIFLRLEPLAMLLLYKHSELNERQNTPLADALSSYGLPHRQIIDITFEQKLEDMAEQYGEVLLLHEIAEAVEEVPEWKEIIAATAGDRQLEHYLRAVKDLLADTSPRGPYNSIIAATDRGALGLTIALTDGYRKILFPEMKDAYSSLIEGQDWSLVEKTRQAGYERFRTQRDAIVKLFRSENASQEAFVAALRKLITT